MIEILPARAEELDVVWLLVRRAVAHMNELGNPQWGEDYPTRDFYADDLARGELYAARSGGVSACWKSSLSLPSLFSEFGGHAGNVDAQNGAGFHRHHRRDDMQTAHPTSPCAGVNRRLTMSSRASRLAPLSALRLYTSPGATSNQVIFPAPLSS